MSYILTFDRLQCFAAQVMKGDNKIVPFQGGTSFSAIAMGRALSMVMAMKAFQAEVRFRDMDSLNKYSIPGQV